MKIAFECRDLNLGSSGGIAQFWQAIIKNLVTNHPENEYFVFYHNKNTPLIDIAASHIHYFYLGYEGFFEQIGNLCLSYQVDIVIRTFPNDGHDFFPEAQQIVEIPDMQHEYFPDFFHPEVLRLRRLNFNYATARFVIITLSQTSKKAIEQHPWLTKKDIYIVSPALLEEHTQKDSSWVIEDHLIPTKPYFYYPANLWPHKNHLALLAGFKKFLAKSQKDYELILTGDLTGWDELSKNWENLPIKHLGFVSKELVSMLIKNAEALTFFSLYEGFGMPLLEAFAVDTPVICSNTTSLPEVGGDAVLQCAPDDIDAIAELMIRISSDIQLRNTLIIEGRKRLENYTWDQSVKQLLLACNEVLQKSKQSSISIEVPLETPWVTVLTEDTEHPLDIYTHQSIGQQTYKFIETIKVSDFQEVTGLICVYLHAGDVLLPNAIEKIINYFKLNPEWDLIYSNLSRPFWRTRIIHFTDSLEDILYLDRALSLEKMGAKVVKIRENLVVRAEQLIGINS